MKLVIDLGMHSAEDTDYYLARGYRVVALEPNPAFVTEVSSRLQASIESGALTIVEAALAERSGEAKFFVSKANSEWSSLDPEPASAQAGADEIMVRTVTLGDIVAAYGDPYYIKCDIEGADGIFCEQLRQLARKPAFVSVEGISLDWLALLYAAGYRKFQLVNQAAVRRFAPSVSFGVEGQQRSWAFGAHSSGPFGDELPKEWLSFEETAQRWLDFHTLKKQAPDMVLDNWFDFHASL